MAKRPKAVENEAPASIKWACITLHPKNAFFGFIEF